MKAGVYPNEKILFITPGIYKQSNNENLVDPQNTDYEFRYF